MKYEEPEYEDLKIMKKKLIKLEKEILEGLEEF